MIANIVAKRSNDPSGLVNYLSSTREPSDPSKHHNVHQDPRVVGGNLGYTGPLDRAMAAQLKADLRAMNELYPDVEFKGGSIYHFSLSATVEDGQIPDATWAKIGEDFMRSMGFIESGKAPVRWALVNHGPSAGGNHHVHGVVNLIREDGTKASIWMDRPKAMSVMRELERKYGLAELVDDGSGQGYSIADADASRRRGQPEPARVSLERTVRGAAVLASNEGEFIQRLRDAGLHLRPKIENGKVLGYSVSLANSDGQHIWYAGRHLARDLSLPRLRTRWPSNAAGYLPQWRGAAQSQSLSSEKPDAEAAGRELTNLSERLQRGVTPQQHARISYEISGALALASTVHEPVPGPLARAAREAARGSATRSYVSGRAYPDLTGITMAAIAASKPGNTVMQAILLRQLLNTFDALINYRRAVGAAGAGKELRMHQQPEHDEISDSIADSASVGLIMAARALEVHLNGRARDVKRRDVGRETERPRDIDREEWRGMDPDQKEQASVVPAWRQRPPTDAQKYRLTSLAKQYRVKLDNDYPHWSRGQMSDAIDELRSGKLEPGSVLTVKRTTEERRERMAAGVVMLNPRQRRADPARLVRSGEANKGSDLER